MDTHVTAAIDKKIEEIQLELNSVMAPFIKQLEALRATRNLFADTSAVTVKGNGLNQPTHKLEAPPPSESTGNKTRLELVMEAILEAGRFLHKREIEQLRTFTRSVSDVLSEAGANPKIGLTSYSPTKQKSKTYWGLEQWLIDGKPLPGREPKASRDPLFTIETPQYTTES